MQSAKLSKRNLTPIQILEDYGMAQVQAKLNQGLWLLGKMVLTSYIQKMECGVVEYTLLKTHLTAVQVIVGQYQIAPTPTKYFCVKLF